MTRMYKLCLSIFISMTWSLNLNLYLYKFKNMYIIYIYIYILPCGCPLSSCLNANDFVSMSCACRPPLSLYIYIYMLWCYYLGQVWPFEVLLSGPSLLITKHCLSKNTIKIGVSALFFCKKKLRAQIWGVIIWAKLVIFKMQSTWPK